MLTSDKLMLPLQHKDGHIQGMEHKDARGGPPWTQMGEK
jgi:hypothetical protein